ncbi:MAG: hypothetical protein ABS67_03010 [Niabella sp. SCN 42-15]|nr:MAG: hypothetical protein ABS67_03010 [Niabella sp. SCN 42-15]
MKKFFTTALMLITAIFCNAQNWELKVNAGGNTTFVKDIMGKVFYRTDDGKFPWEDIDAGSPVFGQFATQAGVSNEIGFYANWEVVRHLRKRWSLSLSAGIDRTNFTYDIPFWSARGIRDTISMKDIDENFGDTKLLYLSSKFLNVTKSFSNLNISAGPVLNFLLHDNGQGKIYSRQNADNTVSYIASPLYKPAKFLYGGNLALGYKLAKPLELKAGAQYFFNSIYKKGENKSVDGSGKDVKVNPCQIDLGLSYSIMKF